MSQAAQLSAGDNPPAREVVVGCGTEQVLTSAGVYSRVESGTEPMAVPRPPILAATSAEVGSVPLFSPERECGTLLIGIGILSRCILSRFTLQNNPNNPSGAFGASSPYTGEPTLRRDCSTAKALLRLLHICILSHFTLQNNHDNPSGAFGAGSPYTGEPPLRRDCSTAKALWNLLLSRCFPPLRRRKNRSSGIR